MRALVFAVLGWASAVAANFHNVDVYPGSGDDEISFYGTGQRPLMTVAQPSSLQPSATGLLTHSKVRLGRLKEAFYLRNEPAAAALHTPTLTNVPIHLHFFPQNNHTGAAVYVYGTVACGWQGLLSISVDGVYNTTINRCNCDVTGIPTGGSGRICHFPWLAKDGLDPTVEHTLSLMLVGPTLAENPSGNVIAELRSIRYTVPNQSSSVDGSPTDDDDDDGDDEDEPTSSTAVPSPSITAENADAPLPQLASLHLSTAATCGVIIGIVLFFLLALVACLVLRRRSQQRKRRQQQAATMANVMAGPRSGMVSQGRARYPTEHLSWSPAAERLEARQQASSQSGKRGSVGSNGRSSWGSGSVGRHGGRRSRMDSIPEADWEHSDQRVVPADEEKGGFSWASGSGASLPPSSPTGSETERRASERAVYTSSDAVPSTARMTFPSIAAAGDYWNRRTSRGSGRFSALPPSPLRTSLVAGDDDDRLRPAS